MSSDLIASVCNLPRDFRSVRTKSVVALLRASGYFDHHAEVTVDSVRAELAAEPALVRDWLSWSADKRTNAGWYLLEDGTVGYHPDGPQLRFTDSITACAQFIVRELE